MDTATVNTSTTDTATVGTSTVDNHARFQSCENLAGARRHVHWTLSHPLFRSSMPFFFHSHEFKLNIYIYLYIYI